MGGVLFLLFLVVCLFALLLFNGFLDVYDLLLLVLLYVLLYGSLDEMEITIIVSCRWQARKSKDFIRQKSCAVHQPGATRGVQQR